MHIYHQFRQIIITHIEALVAAGKLPEGLRFEAITAEPPRDASHGDIATNAAMVLAKPAKQNPRAIAQMLVDSLEGEADIASVSIAGPGFINLSLVPTIWHQELLSIAQQKKDYGTLSIGENTRVNIEYVSANPTGPMHIGHARGAVVGDAIARLLTKAGYDVTKEYYINDAGAQVKVLARSALLRYRQAKGEAITIEEGLYPGDYLVPVGEALLKEFGPDLTEDDLLKITPFVLKAMMEMIRDDLGALGVEHDVFTSEAELTASGGIEKGLELLKSKELLYHGILPPPKGTSNDEWEEREQLLFASTGFGDDTDRALQKSDGSWTYFAADVAYHHDKISRGFDDLIIILGADHGGYVKRLKAIVGALSDEKVAIDVKLTQLVNLLDGGVPMKMSKRAGTFVTVRDVIDSIGKDIIRFMMLTRKNDAVLDFDLLKVKEHSKDNPVFYVQYAYARASSVLRHGRENENADIAHFSLDNLDPSLFKHLVDESEIQLIKLLCAWPRVVEQAAQSHEPHRIAFYVQELAAQFHALWNKGNDEATLRFIIESEPELTKARLTLLTLMNHVFASALDVIGVEPVEQM